MDTPRPAFSWVMALLFPVFAVYLALAYPIEEIAYDAAAIHVPRGVVFSSSRSDGWVIPRWTPDLNAGLGSPVFSYYSPLPYSLMDLLSRLGIPHPLGWRLLVALALELASAGAFGLGLALSGRAGIALAGAAGFTYTSYLLPELFDRGSPQGMAIALSPWVLWCLVRLWERPTGLRFALSAAAWACLILIHNLSALLLAPVIVLFLIHLTVRAGVGRLVWMGTSLLAGTLLAAFHVLPFVLERNYVQLGYINKYAFALPAQNALLLRDLVASPRVFDVLRVNNGMAQAVGPAHAVLLLLGVPLACLLWQRRKRRDAVLVAGLTLLGLAVVWLQLAGATPVWAASPALDILQFRWRLLGMLAPITLAISWYLLLETPERLRRYLATAMIVIFVGLQLPSLFPQLMHPTVDFPQSPTLADVRALGQAANLPGLGSFDEFLPIWRTEPLTGQETQAAAASLMAGLPAGARVLQEQRHPQGAEISLETPVPFDAAFRMLYYPGWQGYIDGRAQTLQPATGSGYLSLPVPAGAHTIVLRYEGTAVQHTGEALSLLAALALLILGLGWRRGPAGGVAQKPVYLRDRWWMPALLITLAAGKGIWLDNHTTWLRCTSAPERVCGAQTSASATFSGGPRLRGYTVSTPTVQRDNHLRLTLFWEGVETDKAHPDCFIHLRSQTGSGLINPDTGTDIWAQEIHTVPDSLMRPGRLFFDEHRIQVPAGTPPGQYLLEVGWYDPVSGEQLDVKPQSLQAPLRVLWRSVLLPDVTVVD